MMTVVMAVFVVMTVAMFMVMIMAVMMLFHSRSPFHTSIRIIISYFFCKEKRENQHFRIYVKFRFIEQTEGMVGAKASP